MIATRRQRRCTRAEGMVVLLATLVAALPGSGRAAPQETPAPLCEVPFELASNKPFVPVRVRDARRWFILDTGCGGTSVLDLDLAVALGLPLQDRQEVHTGAGSGTRIETARTTAVPLDVGGLTLRTDRVIELGNVSPFEGRTAEGLLGGDFFRRFVVEVDYAALRLRVHDPGTFQYQGPGRSMPLEFLAGIPMVAASLRPRGGTPLACRLLVDTGARVTLILNRPFTERHDLRSTAPVGLTGVIGFGAGGETRGDVIRLDSMQWGPFHVSEPVAILSLDTVGVFSGTGSDGLLGGELLRRARVYFDYPGKQLLVEPYAARPAPYEYDMSGLFLTTAGADFRTILVHSVAPDTPAATAGIQPGDRILAVNGRPATTLDVGTLRDLLRQPDTRCRLQLERNGRRYEVTLELRRLV